MMSKGILHISCVLAPNASLIFNLYARAHNVRKGFGHLNGPDEKYGSDHSFGIDGEQGSDHVMDQM